jgi:hypothetical protein
MGVYIKGMEMPKSGIYTCELGVIDENTAVLTILTPIDEPQRSYKLIPVPPHGRLIDAEEFERYECNGCDGACEALSCDCTNCDAECRCDFMLDIHSAPTIIEAEEG